MSEYIRDVEKIIDDYHKSSPLFKLNRKSALFKALTVFEDACRLGGSMGVALTADDLEHSFFVRKQLDAIGILVNWIYQECSHSSDDILDTTIFSNGYLQTANLLLKHAEPYSPICSAYISYSRGHFTARVDEKFNKITFEDNPNNRNIVIADIAESINRDQSLKNQLTPPKDLSFANNQLIASIKFKDKKISYNTDDEIWIPFYKMMEKQWCSTSELPEDWVFDKFSLKDFKEFWIATATICFIHMLACLKCGIKGANVEEAVLLKSSSDIIEIIVSKTNISHENATNILKFLTYNPKLKNNDIVYQPFIELEDDTFALAPHLILSSRPERNLVALLHKIKDNSYFELTNLREGFMQDELDVITSNIENIMIAKNKSLPGRLPDVDYAIWDKENNTILVCELKWLIEPDSTPEVFARIQDLEHGCSQILDIVNYGISNQADFADRIFGITNLEDKPEIIGCVISKNSIRVDNSDVPVINLQTLLNALKQDGIYRTIESIKNKQYLVPAPQNFEFGVKSFSYAGYTFEIPALLRQDCNIGGTYKRIGPKIGRNDPCPCGSGLKYKKCCGK